MSVNLETSYLGLTLSSPLVVSASPLGRKLANLRRLEEAGAAAVVLPSLFEEQIEHDSYQVHAALEAGAGVYQEAARGYLPEAAEGYVSGSERYLVQLRSLPDGGAWALTTQSRLQVFDGAAWEQLPADAPVLGPAWAPDGQLQLISLRAPFDAVTGPLGTTLGWAASREHLYQILAGRFEAVQDLPRGQVLDLQLVDPRHGWAIAYQDPFVSGSRPPGVLLRLVDRRWSEVDLVSALRDNADAGHSGGVQPAADARTVRWWLMSAVSETEVWLYGGMGIPSRPGYLEPILVRFRADPRGGPARDVVVFGRHRIQRLDDAVEVDRFAGDGQVVTLDQVVVQVHLAQVIGMHGARHARRIHVPEQHVERRQRFAEQVTVDPVVPDQTVRAQHAERGRHFAAVKVAALGHRLFQRTDTRLVNEDVDVAGM